MRIAAIRARLGQMLAHPAIFLLGVNAVCAILGLAQFAYTLAILRPVDFAVIGVLAAIGGVMTGLLDLKLADLTTRLFFAVPKSEPERRGALLAASLVLHVAMGLAASALAYGAAILAAPRLLTAAPELWWIAVMATRLGSVYPMAALTTFLRLLGAFQVSGWFRLATQTASTAITIVALSISPDLTGYFAGAAAVTVLTLVTAMATAALHVRGVLGSPLVYMPRSGAFRAFFASGFFLAGGSLAGVSKLLSRSCDTLIVASFGNDTLTGLYRVARQGYDTLAGVTDAVHQFYTPTIVDCVTRGRWAEFRKHRNRLMLMGLAAVLGAVLGSWYVLRPLATTYYPQYSPALTAFEIFAPLLFVTLGIHGWLWPALVASGRIWCFGVLGILGALVQLGALALLTRFGPFDLGIAAMTAWLMAATNYGPLLAERFSQRARK